MKFDKKETDKRVGAVRLGLFAVGGAILAHFLPLYNERRKFFTENLEKDLTNREKHGKILNCIIIACTMRSFCRASENGVADCTKAALRSLWFSAASAGAVGCWTANAQSPGEIPNF